MDFGISYLSFIYLPLHGNTIVLDIERLVSGRDKVCSGCWELIAVHSDVAVIAEALPFDKCICS